jgi:hypothetical protein
VYVGGRARRKRAFAGGGNGGAAAAAATHDLSIHGVVLHVYVYVLMYA